MNKKVFYYTLSLSIIVQAISGVLDIGALFVKLPTAALLIRQLLLLELAVYIFPALSIVISNGALPVVPKIVDIPKGVILLTLSLPPLVV